MEIQNTRIKITQVEVTQTQQHLKTTENQNTEYKTNTYYSLE